MEVKLIYSLPVFTEWCLTHFVDCNTDEDCEYTSNLWCQLAERPVSMALNKPQSSNKIMWNCGSYQLAIEFQPSVCLQLSKTLMHHFNSLIPFLCFGLSDIWRRTQELLDRLAVDVAFRLIPVFEISVNSVSRVRDWKSWRIAPSNARYSLTIFKHTSIDS